MAWDTHTRVDTSEWTKLDTKLREVAFKKKIVYFSRPPGWELVYGIPRYRDIFQLKRPNWNFTGSLTKLSLQLKKSNTLKAEGRTEQSTVWTWSPASTAACTTCHHDLNCNVGDKTFSVCERKIPLKCLLMAVKKYISKHYLTAIVLWSQ